jgi:hypothetical protein
MSDMRAKASSELEKVS